MLPFKQHVVKTSGGGGRGVGGYSGGGGCSMEPSIHIGSQREALSKDNSGLRLYLYDWAPLRWSDVLFAQMCGFKAEEATLQYPSGGPGPPLIGKETDCPMSQHGLGFASDAVLVNLPTVPRGLF